MRLTDHEYFQNFIMFCIVGNVAVMMLDQYPPPPLALKNFLDVCNWTFTVVFAVEMVLLILAIGPLAYAKNKVYLFNGLIVFSSLVELCFQGGSAVTCLRGFRLA